LADLSQTSVIFDLDGTLIDSAPDIHATANRVMAEWGYPALSRAEVQGYVGKGMHHLVACLLTHHGSPAQGPLYDATLARFQTEYLTAHALTTVYPNAQAALATLQAMGARLGICTNKPIAPTLAVLAHLNLTSMFHTILGGDSLPIRKPDPKHLFATARAMGRQRVIFVGDSEVDADTAQAAETPFLLFTEGYRKTPVDQMAHLAAFDDWAKLPELIADLP
jgi:phosphoglycolate phosphatase